MIDLITYLFFIGVGFYGTFFYKRASREAISGRRNFSRKVFRWDVKVDKRTELFHDYLTFVISAIFLVIGVYSLIKLLMSQ